MYAPARYPYDPRWQVVVMCWAFAAALAVGVVVSSAYLPNAIDIASGLLTVFAVFGILITLRRLVFPRFLVLDEKGVWIPSGFLRLNVRRVVFADVSDVWETFLPYTVALCLRCQGKTFEVVSTLLPDHDTYLEVAGNIYSCVVTQHA